MMVSALFSPANALAKKGFPLMSIRSVRTNVVFSLCLMAWIGISTICSGQPATGPWNLSDCLAYGLTYHPSLRQQDGSVQSAEARIGQARSSMAVKVEADANLNRRRTEYSHALRGGGLKGLTDSTSDSVSVRKVLNDSGRNRDQVRALQSGHQAAIQDRTWQSIQVAGEIKAAFYQTLQAQAMIRVKSESYQSFLTHLEKVKGFVEVGNRPPYDITRAEVDVANARVTLIQAESDFRLARARLAQAVGFEGEIEIGVPPSATSSATLQPVIEPKDLHQAALKRPDLTAASFQVKSAEHQVSQAKKSLKPTLSGAAGYDWSGSVTPIDRSWSVAVNLNLPFLDGKLHQYQRREAEGSLQSARARLDSLRLNVRTAVETAITSVTDSFKRLEAAEILLRQASESLHLAEGRYDAGIGSPIEITDARTSFSNAQGTLTTTSFDTLIALSRLDLALGKMPAEAPTLPIGTVPGPDSGQASGTAVSPATPLEKP